MQFRSWPTPPLHQDCLSGSTADIHRPQTRSKALADPSQLCLHTGAWSYSHWGQWELCHQLQWERDGTLMLLLHWNGVQAHPLPRCGLLSFYSCNVFFFKLETTTFFESWPVALAQSDQTRWGCSNKGSWNIKHKRGHMTAASPSSQVWTSFSLLHLCMSASWTTTTQTCMKLMLGPPSPAVGTSLQQLS